MYIGFRFIGALLIFVLSGSVFGQRSVFLTLEKIGTAQGLSSPNVRKIVTDKYGFVWFASQDGLNRFDGTNFIRFNGNLQDKKRAIIGNDVYDLCFDENGSYLYALTAYGGLSKIDIAKCEVVQNFSLSSSADTQDKYWFKCLYRYHNHLFVGTDEGFIIRFDLNTNSKNLWLAAQGQQKKSVDKIYIDDSDGLWLLSSVSVSVLDLRSGQELQSWSADDLAFLSKAPFQINDVVAHDHKLFLATSRGLIVFSIRKKTVVTDDILGSSDNKTLRSSDLHGCSIAGNTLIFAGAEGIGEFDIKTKKSQAWLFSKDYRDQAWISKATDICRQGNGVWIGCLYGVGWIRNTNSPFSVLHHSLSDCAVRIDHAISICKVNPQLTFICADNSLYRSDEQSGDIRKIGSDDFYYEVFRIDSNCILASSVKRGLQLFDFNGNQLNLSNRFPELAAIQNDLLISDAHLGDTVFFMASQNQRGLHVWNKKNRSLRTINTRSGRVSLKSDVINRLFVDADKKLWIVCDNAVQCYNPLNDSLHTFTLADDNGKPLSINMDICQVGAYYYIAVYGLGIVSIDKTGNIKKIIGTKDGITNVGLYKIFRLNDSSLLVSSNSGMFLCEINSGRVYPYFESDGLQSDNFEEASGTTYENLIIAGGMNGYCIVDVNKLSVQSFQPQIYFSSVNIQTPKAIFDSFDIKLKQITIPASALQVVVNYSAVYYENPQRVLFKYRVKEIDPQWIDNGNEHAIKMTGIPPGKYTLELKSSTDRYYNDEQSIKLLLIFLPKWYQTFWFKIVLAITALGILLVLFQYRIAQIRKQQQIRREIASDLHDDIGSTLNSVKIYTHLARREPSVKNLSLVEESLAAATMGLRDLLWVLDDAKDSSFDLMERVKKFAIPLCDANGVKFQVSTALEEDTILSKKEKRNLYLIIKEVVNNALKYAEPTVIAIHLRKKKQGLDLLITDDGKGFDVVNNSDGNGLKNILYRASQINCHFKIESFIGKGTTINICSV